MTYKSHQKVTVMDRHGKLVDGTILELLQFGEEETWWIEYMEDLHREVSVFTSGQLDQWNVVYKSDWCVCGSVSVGHPSHSIWCNVK